MADWDVSELLALMELVLEECTDDVEGLKTKSRFTKFSQFKTTHTKQARDAPTGASTQDATCAKEPTDITGDPYSMMYQQYCCGEG